MQTPTEFSSSGNLKVISTSDGTSGNASIGELPAGASITGDVHVQRYISGEGIIWRYLSSPVTNATIADWQDDFPITGSFDDPSTGPGINSSTPSVYYYGESGSGVDKQLGWLVYPILGLAQDNPILPGAGYTALMLNGIDATVVEVSGPINQGAFSFNISFAGSGWNLIGNPYPATLDWSIDAGWSRSNVANAIYMRNNENGNSNSIVASFVDGVGTNGGTGLIATAQAFWVKAIGNNPGLQLNERAKTTSTGAYLRKGSPDNLFRITLETANQADETVVRFNRNATNEFDPELDALKFPNGGINVSTYLDPDQPMAINALPLPEDSTSLYLELTNTGVSEYRLIFSEMAKLNSAYSLKLLDHYQDSVIQIKDSTLYSFSINQDVASFQDRFQLMILLAPNLTYPSTRGPNIVAYPNPVRDYLEILLPDTGFENYRVSISNSSGQRIYQSPSRGTAQNFQLDFSKYASGIYFVQISSSSQSQHFRVIR